MASETADTTTKRRFQTIPCNGRAPVTLELVHDAPDVFSVYSVYGEDKERGERALCVGTACECMAFIDGVKWNR